MWAFCERFILFTSTEKIQYEATANFVFPASNLPTLISHMTDGTPHSVTVPVTLNVNGKQHDLHIEPRVSLLDALREFAGLTGTKKGCNQGACGACTVLLDGERINSCLTFAIMHQGQEITTIEGLGEDGLHPMQQAFIEHDGFQCGYCTPGQICSAIAMLSEFDKGAPSYVTSDLNAPIELTDTEIKERMSGNLCR